MEQFVGPRLTWSGRVEHTMPHVEQGDQPGAGQAHATTGFPAVERIAADQDTEASDGILLLGDRSEVLELLLDERAGSVNLAYLDPPFATGVARNYRATIGNSEPLSTTAYGDTWRPGLATYLSEMERCLRQIHTLLHPEGSLLLHCDHRLNPYLSLLLDEIFGPGDRWPGRTREGFRNEIVWRYGLGGSSPRCYPKKHDTILWYSKGERWHFEAPRVPATSARMRGQDKKCPDSWDIPSLNNMARERSGYPTQKPLALLERIVLAHSRPGDVVLDPCCGSGTTAVAAASNGRHWIACDLAPLAIHITRKRLLELAPRPGLTLRQALPWPVTPSVSSEPIPEPVVDIERISSDGLRVRLKGLRYPPGVVLPSEMHQHLESAATELVDYWAIDPDWDGKVFTPRWSTTRPHGGAPLSLESPMIALNQAKGNRLAVQAVDLLGNAGLHITTVSP